MNSRSVNIAPKSGFQVGDIVTCSIFPANEYEILRIYLHGGVEELECKNLVTPSIWSFNALDCTLKSRAPMPSLTEITPVAAIDQTKMTDYAIQEFRCKIGQHIEAALPMRLQEKGFEFWHFCKHCGQATRRFETDKAKPFFTDDLFLKK